MTLHRPALVPVRHWAGLITTALLVLGSTAMLPGAGSAHATVSSAATTLSLHGLSPSRPVTYGPPALVYDAPAVADSAFHAPGTGGSVTPVSGGSAVTAGTPSSSPPAGSGEGGWSPMMHCSKMPRIMDLQSSR